MAAVRTHIKIAANTTVAPEECLEAVNRVLVREKVNSMFATCFYGILDTRRGELRYCNAGHNPPWVLRASGAVESLTGAGGIPLGMMELMPYTGSVLQMQPGDALFLYTDGVPEASNAALDDFTDERVALILGQGSSLDCRRLVDLVTQELVTFTAGAPPSDDITMLVVRRAAMTA
jgi:phosphoserine phosphatase RsbU/P